MRIYFRVNNKGEIHLRNAQHGREILK